MQEIDINQKEMIKSFIDKNDLDLMIVDNGSLSSRFDKEWCNKVIAGKADDFFKDKMQYYPAILKLLEDYNLETIRFSCDW